MSSSKTTFFRWPIKDFCKKYVEARNNGEKLISHAFSLSTDSDAQFALFYNDPKTYHWKDCTYGIVSKGIGSKKPIKLGLKVWLENEEGEKFGKYSVQKKVFNKIDDQCEFNVKNTGKDWDFFKKIDDNHKTLFICCELLDLDQNFGFNVDCKEEFLQDQWTLYEEEYHDAVVKVNDTEFKVLKSFFIAHSRVFKEMFNSSFKEGLTNTIEIKDIEEETMMHLVKWFYTSQIEKDASIEKLFSAADKYDIKVLKLACIQLMINSFDSVNAFSRLILAVQHNDQVLMEAALDFIVDLEPYALVKFYKSSEWKELGNKNARIAQEIENLLEDKLEKSY